MKNTEPAMEALTAPAEPRLCRRGQLQFAFQGCLRKQNRSTRRMQRSSECVGGLGERERERRKRKGGWKKKPTWKTRRALGVGRAADQSFIINKNPIGALNRDQCAAGLSGLRGCIHLLVTLLASCHTSRTPICFVNKASGGAGLSLKFH